MAETMPTYPAGAAVGTPGAESLRLRLSSQERNGLVWLKRWARHQLTRAKRRRKYRPREAVFPAEEAEILRALVELEQAAGTLLAEGEDP